MSAGNGNSTQVPDDVIWDENDPPQLFNCTNLQHHNPDCDGNCGYLEFVTENMVNLINEGLAWARAGMNWRGIPAIYGGKIPIPGYPVELIDILVWCEILRDKVIELTGSDKLEFDDEFAKAKYEKLHEMRMDAEEGVRRQRIADRFGVVKQPLLGPDGNPL